MDMEYRVTPTITNAALDQICAVSWPRHHPPDDFRPELERSLAFVRAYDGDEPIGFVR